MAHKKRLSEKEGLLSLNYLPSIILTHIFKLNPWVCSNILEDLTFLVCPKKFIDSFKLAKIKEKNSSKKNAYFQKTQS